MPWELWSLVLPQSWSHPEARAQASAFELSPQRTWVAGRAAVRRDLRTAPADVRQCDTNRRGSEQEGADGQPQPRREAGGGPPSRLGTGRRLFPTPTSNLSAWEACAVRTV